MQANPGLARNSCCVFTPVSTRLRRHPTNSGICFLGKYTGTTARYQQLTYPLQSPALLSRWWNLFPRWVFRDRSRPSLSTKTPEHSLTAFLGPKMMGLGKPVTGPFRNGRFFGIYVRFPGCNSHLSRSAMFHQLSFCFVDKTFASGNLHRTYELSSFSVASPNPWSTYISHLK